MLGSHASLSGLLTMPSLLPYVLFKNSLPRSSLVSLLITMARRDSTRAFAGALVHSGPQFVQNYPILSEP